MPPLQFLDSIRVDLTNKCNARCWFCPYHGKEGSVTTLLRKRTEKVSTLELSDFERIVAELSEAQQFPQFKFSGRGEATTHPHFEEIVRLISASGMSVRLITNGIKIDHLIELLRECNVSTLVSIHGTAEIHDTIVGVPGAHNKARKAILSLKELGGSVSIATTVTPEILPHVSSFVAEWERLGVAVRLQHDHHAWHNKFFPLEDLKNAMAEVGEVKFLPNLKGKMLDDYYAHSVPLVLNPRECVRIKKEVDLRSDGSIYTCRSEAFGNIRDTNIITLITGTQRQRFLEDIAREAKSDRGLNDAHCDRCCYQVPLIL